MTATSDQALRGAIAFEHDLLLCVVDLAACRRVGCSLEISKNLLTRKEICLGLSFCQRLFLHPGGFDGSSCDIYNARLIMGMGIDV